MRQSSAVLRRGGGALIAVTSAAALLLAFANPAGAEIVPKVPLGTAGDYSVLAGAGVTNTGNTTMHQNLGSNPTPAISGFPPGLVLAPGDLVTDAPTTLQAQADLGAAYDDAHLRPTLTATTPADLSGRTLVGGVYAATAKGAMSLTGTVTLDGKGDPNSVWIFQTDSSLITGSGSVVSLINGAQECNVYWQVLSSATLGSGSTFVGNILALTSITMADDVTVHGRALARTGDVTLINDHFTSPTCATSLPRVVPPVSATTSTTAAGGSVTTVPAGGGGGGSAATTTTLGLTVGVIGPPVTGVAPMPAHRFPWTPVTIAGVAAIGTGALLLRRRAQRRAAP